MKYLTLASLFSCITVLTPITALAKSAKRAPVKATNVSYQTPSPESSQALQNTGSVGESSKPSEQVRMHKDFGIGARGGYVVGGLPGYGIDAFGLRHGNMTFGAAYMHGSLDATHDLNKDPETSDVKVDAAVIDADIFLAQARYFFGNSFNVSAGVGQRKIDVHIAISADAKNTLDVKTESTSFVGQIGLSNIWAWDSGFFLGCDWYGYLIPLSSSKSASVQTEGFVSADREYYQTQSDKFADSLGSVATPQVLMVTAGMML